MKVKSVTKWIEVSHPASSLYDAISDGTFKSTKAGKDKWKSLIDESALQENCDEEGLNLKKKHNWSSKYIKIRIGLAANNENNCKSPDSCIGFGISVGGYRDGKSTSCGNLCLFCWSQNKNIPAFGFILIK